MLFGKGWIVSLLIGAIAGMLVTASPASAATASWSCFHAKRAEKQFTAKMNQARAEQGVGKVTLDKQLSRVARRHSASMAADETVYHSNQTALHRRVTRWNTLAENVGRGATVSGTHQGFMQSPPHRANILYPSFNHVGVGTIKKDGILYVSVVFESRRDPGTRLSPPSC